MKIIINYINVILLFTFLPSSLTKAQSQIIESFYFENCDNNGFTPEIIQGNLNWQFDNFRNINGTCNAYFQDVDSLSNTSQIRLTSSAFSTMGYESICLNFSFKFSQYENLNIYNYLNYSYFKTYCVYQSDTILLQVQQGKDWNNNERLNIDLTPYKSSTVQILFEYFDNNSSYNGWVAIDNIEIVGEGNVENETCADAFQLIMNGNCVEASNVGAYFEGPQPNCVEGSKAGVWFQFVATSTVASVLVKPDYYIEPDSNAIHYFNDVVTVFRGTCGNLTQLACSNKDEFGFKGEELYLNNLTIGDTYFVRVSGANCIFGHQEGSFCISVKTPTLTALPINNNCTFARNLVMGICFNQNNLKATFSQIKPSCNELAQADLWYQIQASSDSTKVETFAEFAEVITVYQGNCNNLFEIACADYGHSLIFKSTPGTNYYIQVASAFSSLVGNLCMMASEVIYGCTDVAAINFNPNANYEDDSCYYIENDICANAIPLTLPSNNIFNNSGATSNETNVESDCFKNDDPYQSTLFYTITGDGNTYNISTQNCDAMQPSLDTQIVVFENSCNGSLVACNDDALAIDGTMDIGAALNLETEVGVQYYILIDGYANEQGEFCLNITEQESICSILNLEILFDAFPAQTNWDIIDENGAVVATNNGSYFGLSNQSVDESVCLAEGCYILNFYDAIGNGMCPFKSTTVGVSTFITPGTLITPGSVMGTLSLVSTPGLCGNYSLIGADGSPLVSGGGNFGEAESQSFCINSTSPKMNNSSSLIAKKQKSSHFSIRPNIASDYVYILFNNNLSNVNIEICDAFGKKVKTIKPQSTQIGSSKLAINDLPNGTYFVKLGGVQSTHIERFIKH